MATLNKLEALVWIEASPSVRELYALETTPGTVIELVANELMALSIEVMALFPCPGFPEVAFLVKSPNPPFSCWRFFKSYSQTHS